jgi:hypothetical protein
MELLETDQTTSIAENDDDERETGRLDSYIEWTCPATGTYYVRITGVSSVMFGPAATGTFQLSITEAEAGMFGGAGQAGGDPCRGGTTMTEDAAVISFMPDGNYQDDANCQWHVTCENGGHVTLVFEQFETEMDYDWVEVFDGIVDGATESADYSLSGKMEGTLENLSETQFVSSGESLTVYFESDES